MPTSEQRLSLHDELDLVARLKHCLPPEYRDQAHPGLWPLVQVTSVCAVESGDDSARRAAGVPTAAEVTGADVLAALRLVPQVRRDVDEAELRLVDSALERGETFDAIGATRGFTGPEMAERYQRLGGRRR